MQRKPPKIPSIRTARAAFAPGMLCKGNLWKLSSARIRQLRYTCVHLPPITSCTQEKYLVVRTLLPQNPFKKISRPKQLYSYKSKRNVEYWLWYHSREHCLKKYETWNVNLLNSPVKGPAQNLRISPNKPKRRKIFH